jgi:dihydrofolate reductase
MAERVNGPAAARRRPEEAVVHARGQEEEREHHGGRIADPVAVGGAARRRGSWLRPARPRARIAAQPKARMTTAHVFIAASLDGFIARRDGDIDWLVSHPGTAGEDHGYDAFIATVDGLIMGRGSYEKVLTFEVWPYDKPVVVLSRQLAGSAPPAALAGRVVFRDETPAEALAHVAAEGWRRVYVDGGKVIQAFLRAGLIADLIVTHIPVLLGEGLPLFGALDHDVKLTHRGTRSFPSGLVQSRYDVSG